MTDAKAVCMMVTKINDHVQESILAEGGVDELLATTQQHLLAQRPLVQIATYLK